jgi:hypothetical protein
LGLTQAEVARRMAEIGDPWLSVSACLRSIGELERGRRQFIEAQILDALFEVLGGPAAPRRPPAVVALALITRRDET